MNSFDVFITASGSSVSSITIENICSFFTGLKYNIKGIARDNKLSVSYLNAPTTVISFNLECEEKDTNKIYEDVWDAIYTYGIQYFSIIIFDMQYQKPGQPSLVLWVDANDIINQPDNKPNKMLN